jgi:hypothetical protein
MAARRSVILAQPKHSSARWYVGLGWHGLGSSLVPRLLGPWGGTTQTGSGFTLPPRPAKSLTRNLPMISSSIWKLRNIMKTWLVNYLFVSIKKTRWPVPKKRGQSESQFLIQVIENLIRPIWILIVFWKSVDVSVNKKMHVIRTSIYNSYKTKTTSCFYWYARRPLQQSTVIYH